MEYFISMSCGLHGASFLIISIAIITGAVKDTWQKTIAATLNGIMAVWAGVLLFW